MGGMLAEAALDQLSTKIGLSISQDDQVQTAAYLGSSLIFQGFLEIVSGIESLGKISAQGLNIHQIKNEVKGINRNLKKFMNADTNAALDMLKRKDYENARLKAVSGFYTATTLELKVVCTKIKVLTDCVKELNPAMSNEERNIKLGQILERALNDLLDDAMIEETWERATSKQNQVMNKIHKNINVINIGANPKQEAKEALEKVDDLLCICYETLSFCSGWTTPDERVTKGTLGKIFPKYLPSGQKYKVCLIIGHTEDSLIKLEMFKTKEDNLYANILPLEKLPQAKIDVSPKDTISRRPKECIDVCLELSVNKYGRDTLEYELHNPINKDVLEHETDQSDEDQENETTLEPVLESVMICKESKKEITHHSDSLDGLDSQIYEESPLVFDQRNQDCKTSEEIEQNIIGSVC